MPRDDGITDDYSLILDPPKDLDPETLRLLREIMARTSPDGPPEVTFAADMIPSLPFELPRIPIFDPPKLQWNVIKRRQPSPGAPVILLALDPDLFSKP